ncbi:MAG: ABC transporter permease, partial [Confluentimicrobium sp.]|nr:ABC transporter permease [Actibacterium sp.]
MTSQTNPKAQRSFLTTMLSDETARTNLLLGAICIVVLVAMTAMRPNMFLSSYNFESMAFFMPELGILSIAMMIAMLTGG